jgi:hypothetical protein
MRNRILVLFMLVAGLFACQANGNAQTRVLFGVEGAKAFDNASGGLRLGLEVPFLKRYELDLRDSFSPLESHVALGGGRANIASVGGIVWLTKAFGLSGSVEDSSYNVTKVSKDADYAFGGLTYRGIIGGAPTRFTFSYIKQFNNGISPSGLETSHLQGGDIGFTMRFGCFGAFCVRNSEDFVFGAVKTQGNPACDGSFGPAASYCLRSTAFGGGVTASVSLEFPRHRGHEHDVF